MPRPRFLKTPFAALGGAAGLSLSSFSSVHAQAADALAELNAERWSAGGFRFGGFDAPVTQALGDDIRIAATDTFGGLGLTFGAGNISPFATADAALAVELTVNEGTLDERFVVVLTDDDGVTADGTPARDDHQYDVLLNNLPRGVRQTLTFDLDEASRIQTAFQSAPGDGTPNFGLFQFVVQNNFVNPRGLDLTLHRVSVVSVPEPGAMGVLLGGLALLRRTRPRTGGKSRRDGVALAANLRFF